MITDIHRVNCKRTHRKSQITTHERRSEPTRER